MAHPIYDADLYTDSAILNPYPHYAALRALGGAVWLSSHGLWAIPRYADVRASLRNHNVFSSASGIAVNPAINQITGGTTLASDPPLHDHLRKVVAAPLTVGELTKLRPRIAAAAEAVVERLVAQHEFDAATELAQHLPLTIVSEQVGLPEDGRENMLRWAAATFDMIGPDNQRGREAWVVAQEMRAYVATLDRSRVRPHSWAARLLDQVDAGVIRADQYPSLLRDYLGPSLDTTIFATSSLVWLFAQHPDQWQALRTDPSLARNAINEAVRLESPIRGFTRLVVTDQTIDGVTLPAGARVLLLFASANRDERKWDAPDRFDVGRKVADQLGFGFGVHSCAGMHLARLEIECLLDALIPRVARFEVGEPVRAVNNTLRGFVSLPIRVYA